ALGTKLESLALEIIERHLRFVWPEIGATFGGGRLNDIELRNFSVGVASPVGLNIIDASGLKPKFLPLRKIFARDFRKHPDKVIGRGVAKRVLHEVALQAFAKIFIA